MRRLGYDGIELGNGWSDKPLEFLQEQLAGKTYHVDLGRMFEIARQSSYRGYFSMEFDTNGGDPFTGTAKLIDETLHYFA